MNITDSSVDDSRKIKRRRLAEMAAENLVEETTNENISDITAEANPVRTSARIVENLLNGLPHVEPLRRSARILDKTSSSTEFSSFLSIFNLKITKTTFFCWVNSTKCTGKAHKIYWETEHFILGN